MGALNLQNLKTPTSEEARELGRRGGLASAQSRRRKRLLREILDEVLAMPVAEDALREQLESRGMEPTYETALMVAAVQRASLGDVEALRFVRDTRGEKPTAALEITAGMVKDIRSLDLSALTDAELEALADRATAALPEASEEIGVDA